MFRTKTILILFILIGNYNIYSFIITPITYHKLQLTKIKKLNNVKMLMINKTKDNLETDKYVSNFEETLILLFKTFVDVLYCYLIVLNIFYIIYIIKYM